jgi:glycosyltransferase involved in cell wall biosynthesis
VIAQTDEVAADLRVLLPGVPVHVVPNPVILPQEPPPLNGAPRALFAGRLSEEKDLFGLVAAWEEVLHARPDAVLTLAGAGGSYRPIEAELHADVARRPQIAGSIKFTGWVDDLPELLVAHDVFVLPSFEEGMSNALLEACAAGRLVVASDIPSNRAVLGADHPLLVPAGDRAALARGLIAALGLTPSERAAHRSRVNGRIQRFAAAAVVQQLEQLLAEDRTRH